MLAGLDLGERLPVQSIGTPARSVASIAGGAGDTTFCASTLSSGTYHESSSPSRHGISPSIARRS